MPNWCQNTLTITGENDHVEAFIAANRQPLADDKEARILSFEAALPTPAALLKPNQDGWYNWRIRAWGTKWNASVLDDWLREEQPNGDIQASLRFDTAWSPPVAWLETVGANHPDLLLRLDYTEHGAGYTGYAVAEDGYFSDHEQEYEGPATDEETYF